MLAFSLSNSVTEVGALAAFAALLGIAILSLLVFSQAREIKRLREWAGRAPERAVEMEQRVSADAAARLRGGPPAPGAPVRVVPRKTPLVSAPVSTAVNATVAAVVPGAADQHVGPDAAASSPATAADLAAKDASGDVVSAAALAAGGSAALANQPAGAEGQAALANSTDIPGAKPGDAAAPVPQMTNAGAAVPGGATPAAPTADRSDVGSSASSPPAPATAAARAAGASARAPLPPSPAAPAPPGSASSSGLTPAATAAGSMAAKPPTPLPAPATAARAVPSRAVAMPPGESAHPRSPASTRSRADVPATSAGARGTARVPGAPGASGAGGPKYFKPERSSRRATFMIVGGAIVGVLAIVLAVSLLKGGGGGTPPAHSSSVPTTQGQGTGSQKTPSAVSSNPSETAVVVLNGTSTPDLAHHLASDLRQGGYTLAAASTGVPPGTHPTTVVEYTSGHRADAKAVAKALDVTQVQAIESTIASLASSATVVVLAGADQASQLGGGGAQSGGEPAAGTGGEGTPAGQ
jgi:hypothetical protein